MRKCIYCGKTLLCGKVVRILDSGLEDIDLKFDCLECRVKNRKNIKTRVEIDILKSERREINKKIDYLKSQIIDLGD